MDSPCTGATGSGVLYRRGFRPYRACRECLRIGEHRIFAVFPSTWQECPCPAAWSPPRGQEHPCGRPLSTQRIPFREDHGCSRYITYYTYVLASPQAGSESPARRLRMTRSGNRARKSPDPVGWLPARADPGLCLRVQARLPEPFPEPLVFIPELADQFGFLQLPESPVVVPEFPDPCDLLLQLHDSFSFLPELPDPLVLFLKGPVPLSCSRTRLYHSGRVLGSSLLKRRPTIVIPPKLMWWFTVKGGAAGSVAP